jgi:hypothetical protein
LLEWGQRGVSKKNFSDELPWWVWVEFSEFQMEFVGWVSALRCWTLEHCQLAARIGSPSCAWNMYLYIWLCLSACFVVFALCFFVPHTADNITAARRSDDSGAAEVRQAEAHALLHHTVRPPSLGPLPPTCHKRSWEIRNKCIYIGDVYICVCMGDWLVISHLHASTSDGVLGQTSLSDDWCKLDLSHLHGTTEVYMPLSDLWRDWWIYSFTQAYILYYNIIYYIHTHTCQKVGHTWRVHQSIRSGQS